MHDILVQYDVALKHSDADPDIVSDALVCGSEKENTGYARECHTFFFEGGSWSPIAHLMFDVSQSLIWESILQCSKLVQIQ
jgi:hypothetical protein